MFSLTNTRRTSALAVLLMALLLSLPLFPAPLQAAESFANPAFAAAYAKNPNLWGSAGRTLNELYRETKDGSRQVQYFDKGRMELTSPDTQPDFVGDGKLVLEMVSGRMQVGDTLYWQYAGAEIPVVGGTTFARNPDAPSYQAFQSLTGPSPSGVGRPVTSVLTAPQDEGLFLGIYRLGFDQALGTITKNAFYVLETGHNIPDVFWSYLNQPGPTGLPAFNWQSMFGLPITDAYWAKVRDGDRVSDILVQLFERRTLIYNPAAPAEARIESGDVGRDYSRWRYEQPELPVINDTFSPPNTTPNAKTTPRIGEAGTTFLLEASGFKPDETIDAYVRQKLDGGVYGLGTFRADEQGKVVRRLRTRPLGFPTEEVYYNLTGRSSGVKALWHVKIIGATRYTPAVEAVQPSNVPEGKGATLDRKVLRVGEVSKLVATGFKPNEYLKGWVTTPLNRVVGWVGLVNSNSTVKFYNYLLRANASGTITMELPAPGIALPGIYGFTLSGTESKKTSVAYFRVRSGPAVLFDPVWGRQDFDVNAPRQAKLAPLDVTTLFKQRDLYRENSPVRLLETEAV